MAENKRSTVAADTPSRATGVNDELENKITELDFSVASECQHIESLARAIAAMSKDARVVDLAKQVEFWGMSVGNNVNCFAERLGCAHRSAA